MLALAAVYGEIFGVVPSRRLLKSVQGLDACIPRHPSGGGRGEYGRAPSFNFDGDFVFGF